MRTLNSLALIICVACQDPDPIVGTYDLRTVLDPTQSAVQALPVPAGVRPGLDIPPYDPIAFVIHGGELRMNSNGTLSGNFSTSAVGGTPESDGFSGKWSRTSDGIVVTDGFGYEYTWKMRGDTLGLSCYVKLVCNFTKR